MENKTYSEVRGKSVFDWNTALKTANDKKSKVGSKIQRDLYLKSNNWVTCACGSQCDVIQRDYFGIPVDKYLRDLGVRFTTQCSYAAWGYCIKTLAEIEERSAELIAEIKK